MRSASSAATPISDGDILAEIAPCFVGDAADASARTDTVVLACTHYPLLLDRLIEARALAGRVDRPGARDRAPRLGSARPASGDIVQSGAEMIFTSNRAHGLSARADAVLRRPRSGLTLRRDGALLGFAVVIACKVIAMPDTATPLNRLRQLWREGRPAFGAIATIPSVQTVQIMARSLDWIIVDLEHGPIGSDRSACDDRGDDGHAVHAAGADRGERAVACESADGYRRASASISR